MARLDFDEDDEDNQIRDEKNVRRRVYDALNVLIAAGVLSKCGKNVIYQNMPADFQNTRKKPVESKESKQIRERIAAKRARAKELSDKKQAMENLMKRNMEKVKSGKHECQDLLKLPFVLVQTKDSTNINIQITKKRD